MSRAKEEGFYFWLGAEADKYHYSWTVNWKGDDGKTVGRNEQDNGK